VQAGQAEPRIEFVGLQDRGKQHAARTWQAGNEMQLFRRLGRLRLGGYANVSP